MRVEEIMTRQVQSCRPDDSLEKAAQLMWDSDCGCIPVCSGNGITHIAGVVTDRDICMHALFQGKPLRELHVGDAMAQRLLACKPGDSVAVAEKLMQEGRIRRLPVTDDRGTLMGMITLADLAREALREQSESGGTREITEIEVNDTLAAICQPARPALQSSVAT